MARTLCEGFKYSRNAKIASAAEIIIQSIDKYDKPIARMNLQSQSSVVDSLINEWEQDEKLITALSLLKLNSWKDSLKLENETFNNLYQSRLDDKMNAAGASFTELRAQAIDHYRNLCDTIFAYSIIDKSEGYAQLAAAINLIIADYNNLLDRRENQNEKSDIS